MYKFLICCSSVFTFSGCVIKKNIYYDTQSVLRNLDKPVKKKSICILTFNDIRKDVAGNEIYIQKPREIYENKEIYCINSELHYRKVPVAQQMAWMLADHLTKRGTFKNVTVNKKDSADYIIECNLARITGKQHLPKVIKEAMAAGGAIGGAVGGVIAGASVANIKSKAFVSFALTDVKIYDKDMKLLIEMGSFAKDYEEELHPDANCWCSYENVRNKLKEFYSELVFEIENRISEL